MIHLIVSASVQCLAYQMLTRDEHKLLGSSSSQNCSHLLSSPLSLGSQALVRSLGTRLVSSEYQVHKGQTNVGL